ncbi:MAG: GNAT family N-acetyltransferase [Ruminococcus sp.]|nr:GNAT family N-acetyltransferase [Ruminococcus sp.]
MQIKELSPKDFKKAIQFAVKGMHFDKYLKNNFMLQAYGRYFWYLEYMNATQVIAAYDKNTLLGVLIADMKNEPKPYGSFWKRLYVKLADLIQNVFFDGVMPYNEANKEMFAEYTKNFKPDGEIRFLAADPDSGVKGVGTYLLNELAARENGKEIYLFTDTNCTYQFYERRGFERVSEKEILLELSDFVDLKCFLYRKKL